MSSPTISPPGAILPLCIDTANRIGLHEAVVLAALRQLAALQPHRRLTIEWQTLHRLIGFLTQTQRDQALTCLDQQGLIQIFAATDAHQLVVELNGPATTQTTAPSSSSSSTRFASLASADSPTLATHNTHNTHNPSSANQSASRRNSAPPIPDKNHQGQNSRRRPLDQQWQPAADTLQRLEQHGIPSAFTWSQLDAFRLTGIEQGNNRNDWNTRFFRHVKSQWVYAQNDAQRFQRQAERTAFHPTQDDASPIQYQWQPSQDALEILQRAGIDPQFIQDAVAEFVLYWSERGDAHKTWNSKFIQHIRQQWARYSAAVEHASTPTIIAHDWQPKPDCFDILAMGHIPEAFARQLIPEFVLYWHDTKQVHNSWNSRYLQYVKRQWAQQMSTHSAQASGGQDENATAHQSGYTTAAASIDRLSDTSWADND